MSEVKKIVSKGDVKYSRAIVELVKARLKTMPQNVNISIGSDGSFNRDELVDRVDKGDEIGKKMIELDLEFLRALKEGELYNANYEA